MLKSLAALTSTAGLLLAAGACLAQATPGAPPGPQWGTDNTPPPEWAKLGITEWNMPENFYVTGDPLQLSRENMNSGKRITFVACPYIRDSEPTPLWLADHGGETYFLRTQQNMTALVHHPDLMHKVLVEGVISNEPRVSGGVVLNPLFLSVMPEISPECNRILPADGSRIRFAKRPPGPGSDGVSRAQVRGPARALAERLWMADYKPDPVERVPKTFTVKFAFQDGVIDNQYPRLLNMVKYARDVEASKVEIVGRRGSVRLSDGQVLVERPGIGKQRAEALKAVFEDFHVKGDMLQVRWDVEARPANGLTDFESRYVTITVTPGAPKRQAQAGAGAATVN